VIVATRHGDRSPTAAQIPYDDHKWDCSDIPETYEFKAKKESIVALREDVRVPAQSPYRRFTPSGSCIRGQLTSKGSLQHLALGRKLRKIYIDKLKFLPPTLDTRSKVLTARSTNVWRTKQSAASLLTGLYPAKARKGGVLGLEIRPTEAETMLPPEDNVPKSCPRLAQLRSDIKKNPPFAAFYDQDVTAFRTRIGPLVNATLDISDRFTRPDMSTWNDIIWTRMCHNIPLPCDKAGTCMTSADAEKCIALANKEADMLKWSSPQSDEMIKLETGTMIKELVESLKKAATGKDGTKFSLMSGHDTNVWNMVAIFGGQGTAKLWPPYASNFVIELWHDAAASQHKVRVVYNGEVLKSSLCDFEQGCPLDKLEAGLKKFIPENIWKDCGAAS